MQIVFLILGCVGDEDIQQGLSFDQLKQRMKIAWRF